MAQTRKSSARADSAPPPRKRRALGALVRWLAQVGLPLAAGALLLGGALVLGGLGLDELRARGHYAVAFAEIECGPPPGLTREEFLAEVQYLGRLPDRLDLFAPGLDESVAAAFAAHPWVEEVKRVERPGPTRLRVELAYRQAVLGVAWRGQRRAVDRGGVLLPVAADQAGLPVLEGVKAPPHGRPGEAWGDPAVLAAARTAAVMLPHLEEAGLAGCAVEVGPEGVVLRGGGRVVLWGRPPGEEAAGEPAAEEKVQRLGEKGAEVDLRRAP